jgi:hypothetical protein
MSKKDKAAETAPEAPATVTVKDAPAAITFTGSLLLKQSPVEFCPDAFLDKIGYAKYKRPVFILRPLSALGYCDLFKLGVRLPSNEV